MPVVKLSDLSIGQTVRFKTLNPHDNVLWTGKIVAICDYDLARNFEDIDTIYQDIQRVLRTMPAKEKLTYLVLKVAENNSQVSTKVFGSSFIDLGTLETVKENSYTLFKVYDIDSAKAKDILSLIQSHGYVSEIYSS